MSATLKYISCPVSQLDLLEPISVQTQVDSFKDIEYLPTSVIQDGAPITFEIGKDERYTDASEFGHTTKNRFVSTSSLHSRSVQDAIKTYTQ